MRESVREYWLEFNRPLEGRVNYMYLDTKGLVSAGVGNLIDATKKALTAPTAEERAASLRMAGQLDWRAEDGSVATPEQVAAEWDLVKSRMSLASRGGGAYRSLTSLRISEEEIDRFVFVKLDQFEHHLKGRHEFATFDSWPADAQLGLLSMSWGLGPAFKFPKFQAFVAAGDWNGAATECRFNPERGTIVKRNDLNQELFRNAARVVAEGLDPDALVLAQRSEPLYR
jgi:GH24 family phage-related lysozyme (muramidase)